MNTHFLSKLAVLSFLLVLGVGIFVAPHQVFAQAADETGIGTIAVPPGVDRYQQAAQSSGADIGLVYFMSNMIRLFTVICGIWALFNAILAGYFFLSTDTSGAMDKARTQITQSAIGLMLIVLSYTFTGLIGLIFFGDAAIFLNPEIPTPMP